MPPTFEDAAPEPDPRESRSPHPPELRRRHHPLPHSRPARRRLAGQSSARTHARQRHVLQRQPPHQSHRCVRRQLPPLRLRQASQGSQSLHHVARTGVGSRRPRIFRSRHRIPHRRRTASRIDARLVLPDAARLEGPFPAGAFEGVHHGRDRLSGAALETHFATRPGRAERRGHGFAPRRRRRDLSRSRAPHHLRPQNHGRPVARSGAHRAPTRPALQLHHAVRPYRNRRGSRRSSDKLRSSRTKRKGSSPSSRWRFIPTIRPLAHIPKTTGFDDLRQIAVSRLMLDNIPHIKAYWIMMTPRIAQIAQRFGSDDIDGTVVEEKIYHDAGATTSQNLRRGELLRLISEAGREPVERDTLYHPVQRAENAFTVLV